MAFSVNDHSDHVPQSVSVRRFSIKFLQYVKGESWVRGWVRLDEEKKPTKHKTKNLMTKKFSNTAWEKLILWESMDYNRINTAKKQKLKDQAARQKHYVQTLFELEFHIICLNVPLQRSKMCYLLESYRRLLESALHPLAVLCFWHWFF